MSVPVTTSRIKIIYIGPYPNLVRIQTGLHALEIFYHSDLVLIPIGAATFVEKPTTMPKRVLVDVRINLQVLILHLDQAAIYTLEERENQSRCATDPVSALH